jgi:predicted NBD/HSP70 family sugar kinase
MPAGGELGETGTSDFKDARPEAHSSQLTAHSSQLMVRSFGERSDPMALKIFEQQAMALGRVFTIAANYSDPDAYFLGGGIVEATPEFRAWFVKRVREHILLREEQARLAEFTLVPDLDMAGARGSALAALATAH